MTRRKRITANQMIWAGGFMNFRRAVRHAARYGSACSEAGRLLTLPEYIEASGLSESQAYREQAAWRACCGDFSVYEVVSREALEKKGFSEVEREEVIARSLSGGEV